MTSSGDRLRFLLDEGVPDSVGRILADAGHEVLYLRQTLPTGSPDDLVCLVSELHEAILIALDADMKRLARRHGIGQRRFKTLSLVKLSCRETRAAARVADALSLIEHEWAIGQARTDRRIFIEIGADVIRTMR